jgi:hypothetical protein
MRQIQTIVLLLSSSVMFAQSDIANIIKGGELILGSLSFYSAARSNPNPNEKVISSICIKNKLAEKVLYRISATDTLVKIQKELIIPAGGKECLLQIPKGIYTYEIILPGEEVFKKGEYHFNDGSTIVIKD